MEKQKIKSDKVFIKKEDEKILVIPRNVLFKKKEINGIEKIDFDYYQKLIEKNQQFLWRSEMETNPNYKQIIPYLVFNFEDKYFLMQRKSSASEARLQNKYSLGIGGHIRKEDIKDLNIFNWAKREFNEEIEYHGNFEIEPIGILNDDSNDVGKVHTGFVFLLKGESNKIKIRSELKSGTLLNLNQLSKFYKNMENWSKLVFDFLNK
ncbi:hypothetical protein GF385_03615 [Candidatus Dependentiae bacterium]|nr:hypothetical protein [Candidatus Dependentiae bacterium]